MLRRAVGKVPGLSPIALQPFAGAVDFGRMPPAHGVIYRAVAGNPRSGDYRDFAAVEAWARGLAPRLTGGPA